MPEAIGTLLGLGVFIAAGFLVAVAFYESLSTRDVLLARALRLTRRFTRRRWVAALVYVASVGIGMPILVVLWAAVLELGLFLVGAVERVDTVAEISVAVVAAARILTYVRAKTAHELAKAVPLSFAFLLITGGSINLEDKLARVAERPDVLSLTDDMVLFLIGLELALRATTDGSHAILDAVRRRRGLPTGTGFGPTIVAAIRRRVAEAPLEDHANTGSEGSTSTRSA